MKYVISETGEESIRGHTMTDLEMTMREATLLYEVLYNRIDGLQKAQQALAAEDYDCFDVGAAIDQLSYEATSVAYSLRVRDAWRDPGAKGDEAVEYELILAGGGPSIRMWGDLQDGEPTTAELQASSWGIPWTRVPGTEENILLDFARLFYYGS